MLDSYVQPNDNNFGYDKDIHHYVGLHLGFGLFGGGDAKLLAATAVWTGFGAFPQFLFWTALAGGALAQFGRPASVTILAAPERST